MMTRQNEHIARLRLAAQHIIQADFEHPEDVVRHLLALQAQDYNGALWTIGLRTRGLVKADVEQAIADRKIVRTWPMRGTLHFLHADDVHWMVDLLAPRATAAARNRRVQQLGLTDDIVEQAEHALRTVLKGGGTIRRDEVVKLLQAKMTGFEITNQHTQHLMRNFGERGIICFGPHAGTQPTFVLLDEWVKPKAAKPRAVALRELAERYFISHGPATLKDFAGWGYLTMADARLGLEAAKPSLQEMAVSDTTYFYAPGLKPVSSSQAYLLPGFDEYLLGYKDRTASLPLEYADKIIPGGNGMFLATVVQDGQVIGTWKKRIKKSGLELSYEYFEHQEPVTLHLTRNLKRYQTFLGL